MFTAIYIDGVELSGVGRLFYLRQHTRDEALDIVKKSPLTNDGFQRAWDNLRERYDNKRILVNTQLKTLFNLVPVKTESASEINRLQREINNCISALILHDINISSWDPIFVYICSSKLPMLSLSLWEQQLDKKTEISKWVDLDSFLTARFQSLESVTEVRSIEIANHIVKTAPGNSASFGNNSFSKRKVRTYQAKIIRKSCPLCSKDYLLRFCAKFSKMNPEERFLFL